MSQGGGFCELHGPFDPPHTVCPYCSHEEQMRRAYGPPPRAPRRRESSPGSDFIRQTVEPDSNPNLTEVAPRPSLEPEDTPEEPEGDLPPLAWLVVKRPLERRGEMVPVQANQSIGREADIRWNDPRLSRQHARLTFEPPEDAPDGPSVFHLWPFGPTNPVYINGREIRGATPLYDNDEIRLGDTLFVFRVLTD